MPISRQVAESLGRASWIRRMSDEARALRAERGAGEVFDFSLGNPDLEPPQAFGEALSRVAADPARGTHGYMPNLGYPEVREAVARRASRDQGLEIPAGLVAMSAGAAGGLNVVLKTILDPGDEVLAFRPYFAEYLFYVQNFGGAFVPVDSSPGFRPDPEALRAALSPRTACLILNSPNNPTGRVYGRESLAAVAEVLEEQGRRTGRMPYLVADEPYREIAYRGVEVPSPMLAYPETIVVSSWSKSLSLPGERIGYVAVSPRCAEPKAIVEGLAFSTRVLGFVNAPALMQRTVAGLLDQRADVASYERRGGRLARGLREAGYEFEEPEGAFYLFVRVPERAAPAPADPRGPDVAFAMHLKERGLIAVPGVGFGCPGYFRLSYCVSEATIEGSLPRFAEALESWRRAG
ncbi:MAG TPA: pyridoxal phosphate-dependent aminotransferase [Spirochaetia bacterium]|nr:pyridoxal phosphate-dependent aminotransferase [Spirochaetia bacterium]HRZ65445.1 pyridoxal phosphate-dependent aminotransferase [Spirochaetia bacterium]